MITNVSIRNFQSLRKVDLELKRFTVIVGPSSSGKSALIRALKGLASNVRGGDVITRGQKDMAVTVVTDDHTVTLERSASSGLYRICSSDGQDLLFTKLNGGVPEQVTAVLQLDPVPSGGTSLNFAGQFDKPYLLDSTGAAVARTLGELTNVNTIFEAVREANKTRLAASTEQKFKNLSLAQNHKDLAIYDDLVARRKAIEVADALILEIDAQAAQVERLKELITRLGRAQRTLQSIADLPAPPDSSDVEDSARRQSDYQVLVRKLTRAIRVIEEQGLIARKCDKERAELEEEHHRLLVEAGQCPTCGQKVAG